MHEELVCDMLSRMLADKNAYDKLMELKQKDLKLHQRLGQAIKKALDKLAKALGIYDTQNPDFQYAASVESFGEETFRQLQDLYMRAFVQADANYQAAEKNTTEDGGAETYSQRYIAAEENTDILDMVGRVASGDFIAKMEYALSKPDDIRSAGKTQAYTYMRNGRNRTADTVLYEKKVGEKSYYVVQAVPDTKAKTLYIVTAFIGPSGYKKEASQLINAKSPDVTAKTGSANASITSIRNDSEIVNTKAATDNIGTFDGSNPDIRYSGRDYSYETLTSKPDMKVTSVGGAVPNNRADVVFQAKQNAAKVGKFNPKDGSVSVHVDDIDADVFLGRDGLRHSIDRRFSVNAPVILKAGEILTNSIKINELTPKKAKATESYVLIGAARNDSGELFVVRSVINRFTHNLTSMDVLYAINAKKEPAALLPLSADKPALGTDSTISIGELLDYVNQYFPDILPEDVLKHFGHDSRPSGELGEDALYQDRDTESTSNRTLLANALEGVVQNDLERQKLTEYRENISQLDAQEAKLTQLNAQIKELSFAPGKRDTAKIRQLREEAAKTANRIGIYDQRLLRLEASAPLQKVLEREKKKAYQRAEMKGKIH